MDLPARIGKYELEEYLGGGMAEVYRARDTLIGRTVAVKILSEKGRHDGDVKARFLAEARTAGNLSHENILGIYDFGEDEQQRPFMVMEFLRGEDLRSAIRNEHTGDLRNKLRIALELARALAFIHSEKIVHRDLKPENVHIAMNGQVKLMDFGIAKREGLDLTRSGLMVGTPYYMAPEQVTGGTVTGQADVYAFGVLLYELIAGTHPIAGETMERIFYAILNEPLNPDGMREAGAPETLIKLVCVCTAKAPAERPQGFPPICAELEKVLAAARRATPTPAPIDTSAATVVMDAKAMNAATVVMPERQAPRQEVKPQPEAKPAPAPEPTEKKPSKRRGKGWLWGGAGIAGVIIVAALRPWHSAAPPKSTPIYKPALVSLAPTLTNVRGGNMVLVLAGDFLYGKDKVKGTLPAFYIDRTEVTNAAYQQFCNDTGHALPSDFPKDRPEYPVVNVTIDDAKAFAQWAGKRLPNALEWEKAARGTNGRLYPWGDDADLSRANIGTNKLQPAEAFQKWASPSGAVQMLGNAWEFVDEKGTPSDDMRKAFAKLNPEMAKAGTWYQIRGESFHEQGLDEGALWDWNTVPAPWHNDDLGFRCVRDAK
jgi:eukaryotic-like serine/threonine-protein kinase